MLVGNVKSSYDSEGRGDRETILHGNWSCAQHSSLTWAMTQGSSWQEVGWEKGRSIPYSKTCLNSATLQTVLKYVVLGRNTND